MCTENYHWHHDYIRLAWDSGFAFNVHRTKTNFNWSNVGILDIDRIIRDRDVALVEKHMGTVLNYCLDEEQTKILEPTFVKLFQLGQLALQYLQFCKRYLDNTVILLKKELGHCKEDNSKLKDTTDELKNEISDLKKKIKELKQSVQLQNTENSVSPNYRCNICSKIFVSEEFLIAHIKRRHEVDLNPFQTETDKLQLEIKELKERLNSTEKLIQSDKDIQQRKETPPNNDTAIERTGHVGELKDKFEHLKEYVERELTILRSEKHYQEKYEKWFEMVFQRFENSKSELQGNEEKANIIGDAEKLIKKESSTQTVPETYVESETMTDEVKNVVSEESIDVKPHVDIDIEKIQKHIKFNTENHLDQMQGILEKKLSGGFEQIQTQMNSFWKKLSDMELEKKQNAINIVTSKPQNDSHPLLTLDATLNSDQHVVMTSSSNIKNSESLEKPNVSKVQPIPAPRIVKTYPTIKNSKSEEKKSSPIKLISIAQAKKYQATFSDDTSSDDTVEIVKAPMKITSAKKIKSNEMKDKVIIKPKTVSKYTKTYRSQVADEVSSSEIEEQSINVQPQVKQSTTSTLGQRSLTSLKQIIKDEDVMKGLNVELHEMVNSRLKEIGISPHWTRIPEISYKQAIRVVNHQTELSRKKYSNYTIIREVILKILNEKVKKHSRKSNQQKIKQKEDPKVMAKRTPKKRTRLENRPKHPLHNTLTVDVKNEDAQLKLNDIYNQKTIDEGVVQVSSNILQEKTNLVSATPVKKKVLFDLEDSSSTSKIGLSTSTAKIFQNQDSPSDNKQQLNFEGIDIVNSMKKEQFRDTNEFGRKSLQTPQNVGNFNGEESTTSLTSSILGVPKSKAIAVEVIAQNITKDDISDWDISDILT